MNENEMLNKGQTTADNEDQPSGGGSANPDTAKQTTVPTEGTDNEAGGSSSNDTAFSDGEKQSKEQNAENARRRREDERKREMRRVREETIIEALGGKNPYTGEPMVDSLDVREYETMREIEKNGGDPVGDYQKTRKQKEREAAKEQEAQERSAEWYEKDREAFVTAFPSVKLDELLEDEDFREWADGKVGRKPLEEIYRGFLKFTGKYEERAKDNAAQYLANQKASPGSLRDTGTADSDFFTFEQVQNMSREEVKKNYEKIKESMKKW